jgi:hypothetical protein
VGRPDLTDPATEPAVPTWTRWFARALVATVLLFGLARIEAWPLSGFRLFSSVRHDVREQWHLRAVDGEDEVSIRVDDLPVAYRNTTNIVEGFDDMATAEREEVCDAWAGALRDQGRRVDAVRVYFVIVSVRPDGPAPIEDLRWECGRA